MLLHLRPLTCAGVVYSPTRLIRVALGHFQSAKRGCLASAAFNRGASPTSCATGTSKPSTYQVSSKLTLSLKRAAARFGVPYTGQAVAGTEEGRMSQPSLHMPTVGEIARRLGQPVHRVEYVIRSRHIRPASRAGNCRVFAEDDVAR